MVSFQPTTDNLPIHHSPRIPSEKRGKHPEIGMKKTISATVSQTYVRERAKKAGKRGWGKVLNEKNGNEKTRSRVCLRGFFNLLRLMGSQFS